MASDQNILLCKAVIASATWAVLAIYFGDSHNSKFQACVAATFGLFGLVTAVSFGSARGRKRLLAVIQSYFS